MKMKLDLFVFILGLVCINLFWLFGEYELLAKATSAGCLGYLFGRAETANTFKDLSKRYAKKCDQLQQENYELYDKLELSRDENAKLNNFYDQFRERD